MGDGFAIDNKHVGGIRSGLGYYVRSRSIGATPDYLGGGYIFSSGTQNDLSVGVNVEVWPNMIFTHSDDFIIRSSSGSPQLYITADDEKTTMTQYSPDGNSAYIQAADDINGYVQTIPGAYIIRVPDGEARLGTTDNINIGTNDVNSDVNIGRYGNTVFYGYTANGTRVYSGTGGIHLSSEKLEDDDPFSGVCSVGASHSCTITANTAAGNGANTGYANISQTNVVGPGMYLYTSNANGNINIGTNGTRTITVGNNDSYLNFNNVTKDKTTGGIAIPATGPAGTANAKWIPFDEYRGIVYSWLYFVY